jgi:hypothetical protein
MSIKRYQFEFETKWSVAVDINPLKFEGDDAQDVAKAVAQAFIDDHHSYNSWIWGKIDKTTVEELPPDNVTLGIAHIDGQSYDSDSDGAVYNHYHIYE